MDKPLYLLKAENCDLDYNLGIYKTKKEAEKVREAILKAGCQGNLYVIPFDLGNSNDIYLEFEYTFKRDSINNMIATNKYIAACNCRLMSCLNGVLEPEIIYEEDDFKNVILSIKCLYKDLEGFDPFVQAIKFLEEETEGEISFDDIKFIDCTEKDSILRPQIVYFIKNGEVKRIVDDK